MIQKIGKYRIIERIGRGGMGTVYKAHDPMLDRAVALKVISHDIGVTDELRARFFREAQACARLSHPNVITVYDMGEEDGYLFIVMELLEGDELKQIIAQRRQLFLEEKLSVMTQVCDGLGYAHQKGVIHRDVKPGNIFVLHTGQVKILDFGIARLATADANLTRTGLIIGTLRYMSPEQARGRVDLRSDIFSVGAVFYELLANRAPFLGDDPIEILEQLRSHDPPSLLEIDPSLPPALAAAVQRALQKDPGQRYGELAQLRTELDAVQRTLTEEAQQVRQQVFGRLQELRRLQSALAEQVGSAVEDDTMPLVGERSRLAAVTALDHEIAAKLEAARARLARAEALAPVVARALEQTAADPGQAVAALEAVVAEVPEHVRAAQALAAARTALAERQRVEELRAKLREARTALDRGDHGACREQLAALAQAAPPPDVAPDVEALRRDLDAAVAEAARREALQKARAAAEVTRNAMREARAAAEGATAARFASSPWTSATAAAAEADAAFADDDVATADRRWTAARDLYRQAERDAREALAARERARRAAEEAREQASRARDAASAAAAPRYAAAGWSAAQAAESAAAQTWEREDYDAALRGFTDARTRYDETAQASRTAAEAESRRLDALVADGRRLLDAGRFAEALARLDEVDAVVPGRPGLAELRAEVDARQRAHEAEVARRQAEVRARADAEASRARMATARQSAEATGAARHAAGAWGEAGSATAAADAAFGAARYAEASRGWLTAAERYARAEEQAREVVEAIARARQAAEEARAAAARARSAAAAADAPALAETAWAAALAGEHAAAEALAHEDHERARTQFTEARGRFETAAHEATAEAARREAQRRARQRAESSRTTMDQARSQAEAADAARHAPAPWGQAGARAADGTAAFAEERYDDADRGFTTALDLYGQAERSARETVERLARARAAAEEARAAAARARDHGESAEAARHAATGWTAASAAEGRAAEALAREDYGAARTLFTEARDGYETAARAAEAEVARLAAALAEAARLRDGGRFSESIARVDQVLAEVPDFPGAVALRADAMARAERAEAERQRQEAERRARADAEGKRERMAQARAGAEEATARRHATPLWSDAEITAGQAEEAFERAQYAEASNGYVAATAGYQRAEQTAREAAAALARARADAEDKRRETNQVRDAGMAARASRGAPQAWSTAVATEGSAIKAFEREEYGKARALFQDATRQYDAATRAAAEAAARAAEAEKRRQADERRAAPKEQAAPTPAAAPAAPRPPAPDVAIPPVRRTPWPRLAAVAAGIAIVAVGGFALFRSSPPAPRAPAPTASPPPTSTPAARAPAPPAVTDRERAEQQRKNVLAAREEATRSDAERLAAAQFRAATEQERAAESALGADDHAKALSSFAAALDGYKKATAAAGEAGGRLRKEAEAKRAQDQVRDARRAAEVAEASRLAPPLWSAAAEAERNAATALKGGDFERAASLLADAERGFRDAEKAATAKADTSSRERLEKLTRDLKATAGARRDAETAGASTYAAAALQAAQLKEEEAQAALDRKDFGRAESKIRDAKQDYQRAAQDAQKAVTAERERVALLQRQQGDAEQAREQAATQRRAAEQANADRLAGKQFAAARAKETEGQTALGRREYAPARQAFQDASTAFQSAALEAQKAAEADRQRLAREQRQQTEAEQARDLMSAQRRAAEQAGAERLAGRQFAAARAKETEAQGALGRHEYPAARQAFQDATAAFQSSAQEAQKAAAAEAERQRVAAVETQKAADAERQRLAAVKQEIDQARTRVAAEHDAAVKGEADTLAKEIFDRAVARESEANRLATAQNAAAARQAFQDAAAGFGEATRQARVVRESRAVSEQARARMLSEKQRAREDSPDFTAAVARERQANTLAQRLAFKEAADSYRAAADLFARTVPATSAPAPKAPTPDPQQEIRSVIETYAQALERKDLALLQKVSPGLKADDLRRIKDSFERSQSLKAELKVEAVDVTGDEARARGRRQDTLVSKDGRTYKNEGAFTFKLKRRPEGWVIEALN